MPFDVNNIRKQFPALEREAIFFDNPGGTQISRSSAERIQRYYLECNANHGGVFRTSQDSDALIAEARQAAADFLNAARPEEIVIGPNMTSLTFNISRSIVRTLHAGDTIVVTRLDHDANISPWLMAAEDRGCRIRWVDIHPENGTLDLEDMQAAIKEGPKLVAVGYASNALGTINPVKQIIEWAHAAGALTYIDAVQYAPHGPIDVQQLGCDFLVCSAYKFFGPHLGVLYGRYELLDQLTAYRVRPAPQDPPGKFETGTGNFEHMAGLLGALEYFEWVGEQYGQSYVAGCLDCYRGRALRLKQGVAAIQVYEHELGQALLDVLQETPGVTIYGLTERQRLHERVPTYSFNLKGMHPQHVAEELAKANIYVWNGNYYALAVTTRLGIEESGGMVRVGPVHYNTIEEVEKFGEVLRKIAASSAH